jgi:hypothetical protein
MTFNSSKADAQDLTASGRVVPTADPHASKWETIFGQFKALAVKLYIAFWSRAEYLLVSKALFEIQPTREYTAKTFLARLTFEQES